MAQPGAQHRQKLHNYFELIDKLKITLDEFENILKEANLELKQDYFVLFYTGLDKFWKYNYYETGWNYPYFLNPYPSESLVGHFIHSKIKGVGSDCMQIENPIINISMKDITFDPLKDELTRRLKAINMNNTHSALLNNSILLIENLTNLKDIINKKVLFICLPPKFAIKEEAKNSQTDDNSFVRAVAIDYCL